MNVDLNIEQLTDEELATEAVREGSSGIAFTTLVSRFRDRVWGVCYRLLQNREDAYDAAQETFVVMFAQRAKFEGRSKYSTWVYGIATRTCLAHRRARSRRFRHETIAKNRSSVSDEGTAAENKLMMIDLLQQLSEEDQTLMVMKFVESYSYDEIAAATGLSVSACKMRISRARQELVNREEGDA